MTICRITLALLLCVLLATPAAAAERRGRGALQFRDAAAINDKVVLRMRRVSPPDAGTRYEGWLVSDDGATWTSIGALAPNAEEDLESEWTSPTGENLLERYSRFAITAESEVDADPAPNGAVVYDGRIAPGLLGIVRQLLVRGADTPLPNQVGVAVGLREQAEALRSAARRAQNAARADRRETLSSADESIINVVEGINSGLYGDRNNDGEVSDPGDTYGLLRYAAAARQLLQQAAASPDASEQAREAAQQAIVSIDNIAEWAAQARNLALVINSTTDLTTTQIIHNDISFLADQALRGADGNGNSMIEIELGEGGAQALVSGARGAARIEVDVAGPEDQRRPAQPPAAAGPRGPGELPATGVALVPRSLPDTSTGTAPPIRLLLLFAGALLASGALGVQVSRRRLRC